MANGLGNDTKWVARCGNTTLLTKLGACFGKFKGILASGVEFSSWVCCRDAAVRLHIDWVLDWSGLDKCRQTMQNEIGLLTVAAASTPPATPPEISETIGCVLLFEETWA